jgi:hypothetical protein
MTPLLAATRSSRRCCSRTVLKWHMRPKGAMILTLLAHGMPFQDASLNETDMDGTPRGTPVWSAETAFPPGFHVKHASERPHGPPRSSLPTPTRQRRSGGGTPREASRQEAFRPYIPPTQTSPRGRSKSSAPANGRCQGRSSAGDPRRRHQARQNSPSQHSANAPSRVREYLQSRGEMRAEPMDRLLASSSGHFSGRSRPDKAHELTAANTGRSPLRPPRARLTPAPAMWRPSFCGGCFT